MPEALLMQPVHRLYHLTREILQEFPSHGPEIVPVYRFHLL